jgi:ABC-type tungstate transport system permease subunit
VLEDARLAVLPIEMVIMEWKLSREVVVIHAQGQSLEEHIVFHGFLVERLTIKLDRLMIVSNQAFSAGFCMYH